MFEISKTFAFSAGHRLTGLPDGHKCARVHGHNYAVMVRIAAPRLDRTGFVMDYGDLAPFAAWLDSTCDHRWLGAGVLLDEDGTKTLPVLEVNPTAENLAAHFRAWLMNPYNVIKLSEGAVVRVGVSETPKTWAWAK